MKLLFRLLFSIHIFVGLGALAGGYAAIADPLSPLGLSAETLKNSPFSDFLIPGIILFTVIGLGNIFSAVTILLKSKYQGYISSVFGWALVIWIVTQVIMLRGIHVLHVIYFVIGLSVAVMAAITLLKQNLFPAKFINEYLDRFKKGNKKANA